MTFLNDHYNEIFKKFEKDALLKDVISFKDGGGKLNKLLNHFFKECIFKCKGPRGKKSPMQALGNNEDMEFILSYVKTKPNFYTGNVVQNVESFFRNGGRLACKVANFDPKNARSIYDRYSEGSSKCILDTSAGFGSRMCGALLSGHSYYGIDPNKELMEKLHECYSFLKDNGQLNGTQECKLYCQGSETFIKELENKCDIMFTSPPYFNLESYSNDNCMSTLNYGNYEQWIDKYVKPTIDNIYSYLKVGGVAMINIKNLTRGGKEKLFDDWFELFKSHGGFEFVETFEIKHQSKKNYTMNCNYAVDNYKGFKEPVMVFRKVK